MITVVRQQKFLREKFGAEDDLHDDEENEEEEKPVWGGKKQNYYGVDNGDFEVRACTLLEFTVDNFSVKLFLPPFKFNHNVRHRSPVYTLIFFCVDFLNQLFCY